MGSVFPKNYLMIFGRAMAESHFRFLEKFLKFNSTISLSKLTSYTLIKQSLENKQYVLCYQVLSNNATKDYKEY